MKLSHRIAWGTSWTFIAYAFNQALRFGTNIVLTRLLSPEIFGIMQIVDSVKTGVALIADAGIGQNIIVNRNAEKPDFYNTAWSINLIRCVILWFICIAISVPLANFFHVELLRTVFPIASFIFVMDGLRSVAPTLLQKRLEFSKLSIFEIALDTFGSASLIMLSVLSPTIWALVFGAILGSAIRAAGSYFLLPHFKHRFYISKEYCRQIAALSKWIFVSSIAFFFATNLDRLYLGKVVPLALLGVYGVARALTVPISLLVSRLSTIIIFPLIASSADMSRKSMRENVTSIRLLFVVAAAIGLSIFAANVDILVRVVFDQRYHAAGWMTPILVIGAWFSLLCSLNEAILLGLAMPRYGAIANIVKLIWLAIGLPIGFATYGALGAIWVAASSDLPRYVPILIGQTRTQFSFWLQDVFATVVFFGLFAFWIWLRVVYGTGTFFADPLVLRFI
jgi:O-antigen/teichoic acid export membrane protein